MHTVMSALYVLLKMYVDSSLSLTMEKHMQNLVESIIIHTFNYLGLQKLASYIRSILFDP